MNDERPLEMLKMLAEYDGTSQAPPDVEVRLRQEFRRNRARRAWRRRALWSGAAFAAGVVVTFVVPRLAPSRKDPAPQKLVVSEQTQNTAGQKPSDVREPPTEKAIEKTTVSGRDARSAEVALGGSGKTVRRTTEPTSVQTSPAVSASAFSRAEETVTDFFPLLDPAPPFERGEILRINLPASVMQTVGLPVREDRLGDRVQADVLVGEEGLPRAIRFVRTDMR